MSKYSFLKQILTNSWQQGADGNGVHGEVYPKDIKKFSLQDWVCLLELYCECNNISPPNNLDDAAKNVIEGRAPNAPLAIDKEGIIKFLKILSLSEYRIDDILFHPPKMREREFSHIAESVGVTLETLHTVYTNWHSGIRKKIFED